MSYPPRPPMGMGMPGMMQGYGYGPMNMMPMPPYMQNPMMRNQMPQQKQKLVPQNIPKNGEDKGPVTTVFVGNITDRAPDAMIRQMLQRCGNVLSWKRVQGASGKLQAFGFCEYEQPDATLRCIRLLNEWIMTDKKLVVKVDAKTQEKLDEWKKRRQKSKQKAVVNKQEKDEEPEEGETKESDDEDGNDEVLDEFTQREDRVAQAGLDAIMREYSSELNKIPFEEIEAKAAAKAAKPQEQQQAKKRLPTDGPKDSSLDDLELDQQQKDLINKEINRFRDAHKDEGDTEGEKEREKERDRDRKRREIDDRDRREKERQREREREREREKERERERERERRERSERRRRTRSRSRSKSRTREEDILDQEEVYERRKLERKLREKEAQYQELLTNWEARERKKAREYEKERDREEERKREEHKEAKRLKEFLEDYDDENDDPKYYKGSALQRRLKEREKEMEADERDRQREKEEIEEIRRKLLDEGHDDVETEIARLESEKDAHLMPRLNKSSSRGSSRASLRSRSHSRSRSRSRSRSHSPSPPPKRRRSPSSSPQGIMIPSEDSQSQSQQHYFEHDLPKYTPQETLPQAVPPPATSAYSNGDLDSDTYSSEPPQPVSAPSKQERMRDPVPSSENSPAQDVKKRRKPTVQDVFNQDDDVSDGPKKRKLVPLYDEDDKRSGPKITLPIAKPQTAEEKRKCIRTLIEKIPTVKEELFAYSLEWNMVDATLMDRRIRPWVNKKIIEYIGDEEPTLSNFICEKVMAHTSPSTILSDIAMVFDEEAEVFVVKMWRLLIYETEAKKLGLVK